MPIVINGSGSITGISAGGLPDGIIQAADLATGVGGKILQYVYDSKTDVVSNNLASQTWWSLYNAGLQVTLTPTSASNKIYLIAFFNIFDTTGQWLQFRFEQDGSQIDETVGDAASSRPRATGQHMNGGDNNGGRFYMMAAEVNADSTSSRSYNLGFRHTSGQTRTLYLNRTGDDTDAYSYARTISTITAMEVAA